MTAEHATSRAGAGAPRGRDGALACALLVRAGDLVRTRVRSGRRARRAAVEDGGLRVITRGGARPRDRAARSPRRSRSSRRGPTSRSSCSRPRRGPCARRRRASARQRDAARAARAARARCSARSRAALRARARQYEARAAIQQRDQFLAMLGHELRNPLGAIVLAVGAHARSGTPERAATALEIIERQARPPRAPRRRPARRRARDLRQGRAAARARRSRRRRRSAASRRSPSARATAGIDCIELAAASRLVVEGDPVRLEQVLIEPPRRTRSSTRPPAVARSTVSSRARRRCVRDPRARSAASASSREMLPRVFDLFAQADSSLDRAEGGMGIGLTLVDRLVRAARRRGRVGERRPRARAASSSCACRSARAARRRAAHGSASSGQLDAPCTRRPRRGQRRHPRPDERRCSRARLRRRGRRGRPRRASSASCATGPISRSSTSGCPGSTASRSRDVSRRDRRVRVLLVAVSGYRPRSGPSAGHRGGVRPARRQAASGRRARAARRARGYFMNGGLSVGAG